MNTVDKKKILLVDDDEVALDLTCTLLNEAGYAVQRTSSGKQSIKYLEDTTLKPSLAIIDLIMPELSGIETIRVIKRKYPSIPILAFSAAEDEKIIKEAIDAGANSVIGKPCLPKDFFKSIQSLT